MQKFILPPLILGLTGICVTNPIAANRPSFGGSQPRSLPAAFQEVQLKGVQLFFLGQPVDQVVSGKKIKKYSLQVTGSGFQPGSLVVVNSVHAYGQQPGELQEQPVSTTYVSATSLDAAFLPEAEPAPGLLLVKVAGPAGEQSNIIAADVISKPSRLSIESISPQSGPIGGQVTLTGVGLGLAGPTNPVAIRFSPVGSFDSFLQGFYTSALTDPSKLMIVVPSNVVLPICPGGPFACDPISIPRVTPQDYRIWVINANGMSNRIIFRVTPG
jgi:hypothetical protein